VNEVSGSILLCTVDRHLANVTFQAELVKPYSIESCLLSPMIKSQSSTILK